jgi:hypothetical protein
MIATASEALLQTTKRGALGSLVDFDQIDAGKRGKLANRSLQHFAHANT